jgi:3-isopropylmalate/(R)-2-methylmalate dehydratase large subunit
MYNAAKTQKKCINVAGDLQFELHQKTLRLYHIKIVTSGATGYFVEYAGKVF